MAIVKPRSAKTLIAGRFPNRSPQPHDRSYRVDPETIELMQPVIMAAIAATCLCIYLLTTPACDRFWRGCGGDWTRAKELPEPPADVPEPPADAGASGVTIPES